MTSGQRTYRGLSQQERQDRRRAALLEAALDAVSDPEVEVSVRAICAKASLTPRYFYESFTGLDDLLQALVGLIAEEILEAGAHAVLAVIGQNLRAQCRAAFTGAFAVLQADPRRAQAMLVLASGHDSLQEQRRQIVIDFTEGMLAFFDAQYDTSSIDPVHARTTILFSVAGTFELTLAFLGDQLSMSEERMADEVAALLASCLTLLGLPAEGISPPT